MLCPFGNPECHARVYAQESTSSLILALGSWPENTSSNFCLYRSSCLRLSVPSLSQAAWGFFFLSFFIFCFANSSANWLSSETLHFLNFTVFSRRGVTFYVLIWEPERSGRKLLSMPWSVKKQKINRTRTVINFSNNIIVIKNNNSQHQALPSACLPRAVWCRHRRHEGQRRAVTQAAVDTSFVSQQTVCIF